MKESISRENIRVNDYLQYTVKINKITSTLINVSKIRRKKEANNL
jgi:hypothetical protein